MTRRGAPILTGRKVLGLFALALGAALSYNTQFIKYGG